MDKVRNNAGAQPNKSLEDGIMTLQALASSPEPRGCRELAEELGLETSRVNRLLKTLAFLGIARQTKNRKYTSGPGMHVLASQSLFASGLIQRAIHPLESLQSYGYIVAMGVLWRDHVSYLFHALPHMSSSDALGRIGLFPATKSGVGMMLLAAQNNAEIIAAYDGQSIPAFPKGIDSLLTEIRKIRKRGYAYFLANKKLGHYTVAVNVGDPVHSAIGLSGHINESEARDLAESLFKTAKLIA